MSIHRKQLKGLLLLLIILIVFSLGSCSKKTPTNKEKITIEHTSHTILTGMELYETEVHIYKSNVDGPKVAIVGGIHGDELAGWKSALQLLEKDNFQGEVLIIPRANYLATVLEKRYPGQGSNGMYKNVKYSDLNRIFPGTLSGTITERIAYEIIQEIEEFQPEYIIDLHESLTSYNDSKKPRLGNSLIWTNRKTSLFAEDLVYDFNNQYLEEGETVFTTLSPAVENTFNDYCSKNFDAVVFTIETNRQLELTRRIEQQIQILDLFFKTIWNKNN